ncbi:MAG: methyltransferase domain-containing protein [Acidobacteria bacterium]|nr:methyltransferase domain-containing protein [Acidobacteriota bacterium]
MNRSLLQILACPECRGSLELLQDTGDVDRVFSGNLTCGGCRATYPIRHGVPRFVGDGDYAASFGLQWNRFRTTQLDSTTGIGLSAERFYAETGWTREWLNQKWVLDAGCGAGRFVEVAAKAGANVVGVDLSSAVDAAAANVVDLPNADIVQASLYALPFRAGAFDACYCIGVLQHTPDPRRTLSVLPSMLKDGGQLAVVAYERRRWTKWQTKYLIRPLTKRMSKPWLLRVIEWSMPALFAMTEVLFRLPVVGPVFRFAIPVANYTGERRLSVRQRYRLAVLDTFDVLSPEFDFPQTAPEVLGALRQAGMVHLHRRSVAGLTVTGTMSRSPGEPTR